MLGYASSTPITMTMAPGGCCGRCGAAWPKCPVRELERASERGWACVYSESQRRLQPDVYSSCIAVRAERSRCNGRMGVST
jgi:hypothetical protein